MNLDTFLISILFNDAETKQSADKINNIVDGMAKSIVKTFTAIASFDFLKNQVKRVTEFATQIDNLSYQTNINQQDLQAWGEVVKRNGGTTAQFQQSISNLSGKIREMQTNFGTSGQLAFMRLGINIKDANGHIKDAVTVLGDLGDKFKTLPKVWQLRLGEQLGLDTATIRLLSTGNANVKELVANMKKLGDFNSLNTQQATDYRNSMYNLQLVWQSASNILVGVMLPPLKQFTELLTKGILFLRENPQLLVSGLIAISTVITAMLIPAFLSLARISAPFLALSAVIVGISLVVQDFIVWMHGGTSAFGVYYQKIADSTKGIREWVKDHKEIIITFAKVIASITGSVIVIQKLTAVFKGVATAVGVARVAMLAFATNPVVLAITAIITALTLLITNWDVVTKYMHDFGDSAEKMFNKVTDGISKVKNAVTGEVKKAIQTATTVYDNSKAGVVNIIHQTAQALGFDPDTATTIASIESGLNPNAKSNTSSAGGLFQLINSTAKENGINDLSQKNNPIVNAQAGINNLKKTAQALHEFLGREATGGELYLGEMLGIGGSKNLLKANPNSPLSQIMSQQVLQANPSFRGMTAGQLRQKAESTYQQHSVSVGKITINAPNSNSKEIAQNINHEIGRHLSQLVTNSDSGYRL